MEALKGIRVIDAANVIAGPYCASILSEFGADVIKVEQPGKGDNFRSMGPRSKDGKSIRWPSMGRNKRCVTLDFHKPEAKEIFLDLVRESDVVIENFRTGTFEKWGLGYEELKKANPQIIVTHVTGYGQTGPNKELSGFGGPLTGFAGVTYTQGYPDKPPVSPSFSLADYVAGLNAAIGTLLALYYRDAENGEGQEIDVSLYEGLFRMQDSLIADYDINGKVRERKARMDGASVPGGKFLTKDQKWVMLACSTNNAFKYLTQAMERLDLYEKYPDMADRFANEAFIMQETAQWFSSHDYREVMEKCNANKVALGPIYSIADIWEDPQYQARHNLVEFDSPDFGKVHIASVCPILSKTPGTIKWIGQPVGSFNQEVYQDLLGYDDEKLKALQENGVI